MIYWWWIHGPRMRHDMIYPLDTLRHVLCNSCCRYKRFLTPLLVDIQITRRDCTTIVEYYRKINTQKRYWYWLPLFFCLTRNSIVGSWFINSQLLKTWREVAWNSWNPYHFYTKPLFGKIDFTTVVDGFRSQYLAPLFLI